MLAAIEQGDPKAAEELLPLVYNELRKLVAEAGVESIEFTATGTKSAPFLMALTLE